MVFEHIEKSSVVERAGFEVGDTLLHWARGDVQGEFDSPFDFYEVETEQAPRGSVTIEGLRGDAKRVWVLGQGNWGLAGRPNLGEPFLSSYRRAEAMAEAGQAAEAADLYRADAIKSRALASPWLGSWLLFHAGEALAKAHRWSEADDAYREAVAEAEARDAGPVFKAELLTSVAWAYWSQGDAVNVEKYHKQALAQWRTLGDKSLAGARSLQYLGMIAHAQGDLPGAEQYYRLALAIEEELAPGSLQVGANLTNLGIIFHERGDLAGAERYYREGLAIEQKLAPGSYNLAHQLKNLGSLYEDRGDLVMAGKYYHQAVEGFRNFERGGMLNMASVLTKLGEISLLQGDLAKAEDYLNQSRSINESLSHDSLYMSLVLRDLGELAQARRDPVKAEGFYQQALTMVEKFTPGTSDVATILNRLGDAENERGDLTKAEEYYRQACALWEKLGPDSASHAEALAGLAGISRRRQQPEAAVQFYGQVLNVLENQTSHLGGTEENRAGFRAKHANYYKDYIDLLLTRKEPGLAFPVLERLRARTLLETLAAARIDIHQGVDPALVAKERSLQELLNAKSDRRLHLSSGQHLKEQLTAFDKEINDLLAQYKDIEEQIRTNSPSYAALTQPQPLGAKEVQQQLLDADTLLLEYSLGEDRSYVFAVTPGSLDAYQLPKRAEIEPLARHVYELLTEHNRKGKSETEAQRQKRIAKAEAEYSQSVAELSRMVLGPVAAQLQGKRLLIVGDGALQYIPFAVLPVPGASSSKAAVPLVVEHEIVSLPSASVLAVLRRKQMERQEGTKAIAVLADPVFVAKDDRVQLASAANGQSNLKLPSDSSIHPSLEPDASSDDEPSELDRSAQEMGLFGFPRLPFTRREAEAIYSIAGKSDAMEALDFDASKATALSSQLKDYRIVHFATHGLLNNEHPELSGLVLSLVDRQGKAQDGFLRMLDIYNMQLNADLVVLSACQTALGKEIGEEGLAGLTRSFMYAGAPRVVASLWKVDDEATAELMKKFYEGMLRNHQTPAQALRSAQQWMRTQKAWQSPYYWAGFVLQGEWK